MHQIIYRENTLFWWLLWFQLSGKWSTIVKIFCSISQELVQGPNIFKIWKDFENNGHLQELDELDQFFLRRPKPNEKLNILMGRSHEQQNSSGETSPTNSCSIEDILAQAHLIEILRERERLQRSNPAKHLMKKASAAAVEKVCVFCRNNGESESYYSSHQLKDVEGNIKCPVLSAYVCPICGATGKDSHTIKYCPYNVSDTLSITSLTKTVRSAAGKRIGRTNWLCGQLILI